MTEYNYAAISNYTAGKLELFRLDSLKHEGSFDAGNGAYPVDSVGDDLVLVSTRGLRSIRPVAVQGSEALDAISLEHKPRSAAKHPSKPLALVGGADMVRQSIVNTESLTVTGAVGNATTDSRRDFGGGLACGHPSWVDNTHFLLLDRISRRVELYQLDSDELLDSVNLPSSPHHVSLSGGTGYILCEGNPAARTPPSVVQFSVDEQRLRVSGQCFLPVGPRDWSGAGAHHLTVSQGTNTVLVGLASGWLHTLAANSLAVVGSTETGPGCGHTTICGDTGLAVTTNHTGRSMSVIDLTTGRTVGAIEVSSASKDGKKTQGHTSWWSASANRLYTTAAQDGRFLEIDVLGGAVVNEIHVPDAYLLQGCFLKLASS